MYDQDYLDLRLLTATLEYLLFFPLSIPATPIFSDILQKDITDDAASAPQPLTTSQLPQATH